MRDARGKSEGGHPRLASELHKYACTTVHMYEPCGGLDESGLHKLICLYTCSPLGETVGEGLGGGLLYEEMCPGSRF